MSHAGSSKMQSTPKESRITSRVLLCGLNNHRRPWFCGTTAALGAHQLAIDTAAVHFLCHHTLAWVSSVHNMRVCACVCEGQRHAPCRALEGHRRPQRGHGPPRRHSRGHALGTAWWLQQGGEGGRRVRQGSVFCGMLTARTHQQAPSPAGTAQR